MVQDETGEVGTDLAVHSLIYQGRMFVFTLKPFHVCEELVDIICFSFEKDD